MTVTLQTPDVDELDAIVVALRSWQREGAPMQVHPGDVGWFWRFGAKATADALRTWHRGDQLLAVALLDGPGLVRLALAPDAHQDDDLAGNLATDISEPQRGVLPAGAAAVETADGALVRDRLLEAGWALGDPWTQLRYDLGQPVPDAGVRVEVVTPQQAPLWVDVQRQAFAGSTFTLERWQAMASGPMFNDARCLSAVNDHGAAVAGAIAWSAGPGLPGILEPVGAHPDHRGRGYGKAISIAAAAHLQQLGASSAMVCTTSSLTAAVGTYLAAGFRRVREVADISRPA